jgi:glutathione S-transferase
MIRLYRAPFSTNVERVALALAYKDLPAESVWIEYDDRGEVERVSGQGLVPVIDDDGRIVADSTAILEYLDDRYPDPPLYPADPARRTETKLFVDWFNRVWKTWPNGIEAELAKPKPDNERIERLGGEMASALDSFESLLTDRAHLLGDDFSAADCIAFPFLKFARLRDPADDELFHRILDDHLRLTSSHRNLAAWIDRVKARPQR